jgi:hypothetical protein
MVDVQMGTKNEVKIIVADAQVEQLIPPTPLAGKVEWRRMPLVLAGAGVDQNDIVWSPNHEGLVAYTHPACCYVEHLRFHEWQMTLERGFVIRGEEVRWSTPRSFALDDRVDGDVADPDLSHHWFPLVLEAV